MNTFYWYDLETSGIQPKWDRIVQFAGMRTDADLNPVEEGQCIYVQLADDVLPNPDAAMVTGLVPQQINAEGVTEWAALNQILAEFSAPQTCVAGYNSLRFDDEFVRYGLFRNFHDPYSREWRNGNRRWDLIDLARATGALRPEGIEWPQDDDGLPVYRLEVLTAVNGLEHGHAHDALSDVEATIGLARLIKTQQPKLFDYYLNNSNKKSIRALLEPYGAKLCVHVSGMYPRARYGCAPVVSLCRHPTNSNSVIVADLGVDVEPLLTWSAEKIQERLFTSGEHERPGLKEIRINRCPFLAPASVLSGQDTGRLGVDMVAVEKRWQQLQRKGLARELQKKLQRVYRADSPPAPAADLDGSLYDGFVSDTDRTRCDSLQQDLLANGWRDLDFDDARLIGLSTRLKARSFPDLLTADERAAWHEHIAGKLRAADAPWLTFDPYFERIAQLRIEAADSQESLGLLASLQEHGDRLAQSYAVAK